MNYLYRHIRKDLNEPFYIGVGKTVNNSNSIETMYARAFRKTKRSVFWSNVVSKTDYEVEILFESESRNFICEKETEFIKLHGRRDLGTGTLVNMTDGGDALQGLLRSKEHTEKIRLATSGLNHFNYNKKLTKEVKSNISDSLSNYKDNLPEDWGSHCRGGKNSSARKVINKITGKQYDCLKAGTTDLGIDYLNEVKIIKKSPEESIFKYLDNNYTHKKITIHITTGKEYDSLAEACRSNGDNYGYQIKLINRKAENAKYKYKYKYKETQSITK